MSFIYDLTDTWDAGATVYHAIKMNVTNTASAAASKLVTLQIGGTDKFTVDKDGDGYFAGNVGIGITAATEMLDINGNARVRGNIGINNAPPSDYWATTSANSTLFTGYGNIGSQGSYGFDLTANGYRNSSGTWTTLNTNGSTSAAQIRLSTSDGSIIFGSDATKATGSGITVTERMRINSSGNVGIGGSDPSGRLHIKSADVGAFTAEVWGNELIVEDTNAGIMILGADTGNSSLFFSRPSDNNAGRVGYDHSTNELRFDTGSSRSMTIDSSGNVLVGTTTITNMWNGASSNPGTQIEDNGGVIIQKNTNPCLFMSKASGYTNANFASFYVNGSNVGSISTTGSATAYNTTSDARLKHDIVDAPDAADLIDAIQVRSFKWNIDNSEQRYGMIAQELVNVAPEAVNIPEDADDMMAVDYSKLVPMLIKEVQSLRARVAQLEG